MVVFNFRFSGSLLMRDYRNNAAGFAKLQRIFSDRGTTDSIMRILIAGSASPEGSTAVNERLSMERAQAVRGYIVWKYPWVDQQKMQIYSIGENWPGMRSMIDQDGDVPYREQLLEIIDGDNTGTTKWAEIRALGGGTVFRYLENHILPTLRSAVMCEVFYRDENRNSAPEPVVGTAPESPPTEPASEPQPPVEAVPAEPAPADTLADFEYVPVPIAPTPVLQYETVTKPLFAIKTNLLFDALTALNVELEVPIGNRWSIAGEYIFPWWLWERKQYCLESLSGNLEGRYWFGNRKTRPVLTGWFVGLYTGAGYYDIGLGVDKGYQGEFFIAAGVSGGYAHTINKKGTLRMEYSLGVGYMRTKYRQYDPAQICSDEQWHLIKQKSGKFSWFGPTRAKISLVWLINHTYKKKVTSNY